MWTVAELFLAGIIAGLGLWATFRLLGRLDLDRTERLALTLAYYPAGLGLAAFVGLLVGRPGGAVPLCLAVGLGVLGLVPPRWLAGRHQGRDNRPRPDDERGGARQDRSFRAAFWALGLFGMGTLGTVLATPLSGGALRIGDWVAHWFLVIVYLGQPLPDLRVFVNRVGDFGVVSRPPLYNLEGGLLVGPLDGQFWTFQIVGALVGVPVVVAAVLWARTIGGARAAQVVAPLCALSPFLVQNTAYPWPKIVAALFVLLFLYLIRAAVLARSHRRRRQTFVLAAACAGLGYLAHQTTVLYVAPTLLWLTWRRPRTLFGGDPGRALATWLVAGLVGVAIVAPWYAWVVATYGLRATVEANPAWIGADSTDTLGDWLLKGGAAAVGTLVPLPAFQALARGEVPSPDQLMRVQLALLTGALGASGCTVLVLAARRWIRDERAGWRARWYDRPWRRSPWRRPPWRRPPWLALVALAGFAGQVMLQPNWHTSGDAAESMTPIVVLGLAYVAREVDGLGRAARSLVVMAVVAEFLLFHALYLAWAFGAAWTRDPNAVLAARYGLTHLRSLAPWVGPAGVALLGVSAVASATLLWRLVDQAPPDRPTLAPEATPAGGAPNLSRPG